MTTLIRTGIMVPFLDVGIGDPYYAHNRFWTRTDTNAGTEFGSTKYKPGFECMKSTCDFVIDGTVPSQWCDKGRMCEQVEAVLVKDLTVSAVTSRSENVTGD